MGAYEQPRVEVEVGHVAGKIHFCVNVFSEAGYFIDDIVIVVCVSGTGTEVEAQAKESCVVSWWADGGTEVMAGHVDSTMVVVPD